MIAAETTYILRGSDTGFKTPPPFFGKLGSCTLTETPPLDSLFFNHGCTDSNLFHGTEAWLYMYRKPG